MSKIDRINSELMKQISAVIERDVKHPQINGIISVTGVETTNDLNSAKVKVTVMGSSNNPEEVVNALNHSAGFIRNKLKSKINIRMIPELNFQYDTNIEYAIKISKIIESVNKGTETEE